MTLYTTTSLTDLYTYIRDMHTVDECMPYTSYKDIIDISGGKIAPFFKFLHDRHIVDITVSNNASPNELFTCINIRARYIDAETGRTKIKQFKTGQWEHGIIPLYPADERQAGCEKTLKDHIKLLNKIHHLYLV